MLKKNDIKLIRSLRLKKYRQKYNKFIVEGEKNSIEAIKNALKSVEKVFCTKDFYEFNNKLFYNSDFEVIIVSRKELEQISNLKTANSIVLILKISKSKDLEVFTEAKTILYLDDITDPGNMGTIIRSCDWFGIDSLVVSPDSVDIHNPKVIQSSMGSIFRLNIYKFSFEKLKKNLSESNFKYYGTELEGESIVNIDYHYPMVIVIGNESRGISKSIDNKLDMRITIPRFNQSTESLNAAVATAIVLYEVRRGEKAQK